MFKIADHGSWSLGTLIWLPICAVIVIGLLALAALGRHYYKADPDGPDQDLFRFGSWGFVLTALAFVLGTAVFMYPYSAEYHQFRDVSGTVERIDSRLIGGGDKSTETKFVVRFDGDNRQFGCDDTRCAGVEAGNSLSLSCKRAWQYTGTDGYDCRFVSVEAKA